MQLTKKPSFRRAKLPETRDNDMIVRKVRVDGKNFALGRIGGYMPSSSGSRSISVGRQVILKLS